VVSPVGDLLFLQQRKKSKQKNAALYSLVFILKSQNKNPRKIVYENINCVVYRLVLRFVIGSF